MRRSYCQKGFTGLSVATNSLMQNLTVARETFPRFLLSFDRGILRLSR